MIAQVCRREAGLLNSWSRSLACVCVIVQVAVAGK